MSLLIVVLALVIVAILVVAPPGLPPRHGGGSSSSRAAKTAGHLSSAKQGTSLGSPRLGVGSCRGSGCHGVSGGTGEEAIANQPAWRTSYTVWSRNDPHSRAYTDLFLPRSRQIVTRLLGRELRTSSAEYVDAVALHCASCHATAAATGATAELEQVELSSGVGCESCHGAAKSWMDRHHLGSGARELMRDSRSLESRATLCADCHVGRAGSPAEGNGPTREVDHRLLAADHPRLNFEFGAYLQALPAHWDRSADEAGKKWGTDKVSRGEFHAGAWLAGQRANANAALDLLYERAKRVRAGHSRGPAAQEAGHQKAGHEAEQVPDWPELSGYDCYACHHAVETTNFRRGAPSARPADYSSGGLPWGRWQLTSIEMWETPQRAQFAKELRRMLASPAVQPDAVLALGVNDRELRSGGRAALGQAADVLGRVLLRPRTEGFASWDDACQWYLAARAAERAITAVRPQRGSGAEAKLRMGVLLDQLAEALEFHGPKTTESLGSGPAVSEARVPDPLWSSPSGFDPTRREFLQLIEGIQAEVRAWQPVE